MLNKYILLIVLMTPYPWERVFSQGGWDIGYVPIQVVDSTLIGQDIRIDFKQSSDDTITDLEISRLDIRELLITSDTITLSILGKNFEFVEEWELYDDEALIRHQTLKSLDSLDGSPLIIWEVVLEQVTDEYVYVGASIIRNKNIRVIELVLDRTRIKGLLRKEYN